VLLLTARDTVEDKVAGFELGADDYLSKPFAYVEFLARIRSLIRRAPRATREVLTVGDESVHFGGVAALRSRLVDVGQ
jgi:two-component system copper resistance phosphate regulon response regulator CusR